MRERDRELKRRRHRRQKRLKKQPAEDIHRPERASGSKRAVKKVPPAPAETGNQAAAVAPPPTEAAPAKKKPAAKKAPAKKAPAKAAEAEAPAAPAPAAPEEPEEPQGA
jgi:hypothetical protein